MSVTPKHSQPNRKTISISISIPTELWELINVTAARRGMTRSQFFTWLFRQHLYLERGLLPDMELPPLPVAPSRIKTK